MSAVKKPRRKKSKKKLKKQRHEWYLRSRHGTFENRLRSCLYARKKDAKRTGLEYDIDIGHFAEQTHCRLLKSIEFCFTNNSRNRDTSLSVDRIDPRLGYTRENTWLICQRANRIKNNATFEEFEEIYLNWKAEIERRNNAKGE